MPADSYQQNYELSHEDIDQVFAAIDIPACPAIVSLAMSEAQRDEPDVRKLAEAIEKDVGMAAMTIKLANSPLFRGGQAVSRVADAVARLGIRNIVCVVISTALRNCMTGVDAAWLEKFWNRASLIATAAGLIAKKQYGIAPDAAYTFALFHDSAIPLLRKRFENYNTIITKATQEQRLLIEVEEAYFPCTHPIVGSLLARNWGLPPVIGQSIRFHHEKDVYHLPEKSLPGAAISLIAVTHVAERMLSDMNNEVNLEVSNEHFEYALAYLGISFDELDEIRERLIEDN